MPGGATVVPVDPFPEHTMSVGSRATQAERIAMRLASANMDGMSGAPLF